MGVDFFLVNDDTHEMFILGRGDWSKAFPYEPIETPAAGNVAKDVAFRINLVWPDPGGSAPAWYQFAYRLAREIAEFWIAQKTIRLTSDADDIGSVGVDYRVVGSRYENDSDLGKTRTLWPYDENDPCNWRTQP